jgi:hypothetical protein
VVAYQRFVEGEGTWEGFASAIALSRAAKWPLLLARGNWGTDPVGIWNLAKDLAWVTACHAHRERIEQMELADTTEEWWAWRFGGYHFPEFRDTQDEVRRPLPSLLREVVGNPFRPSHLMTPLPKWITMIAAAAYDARDPTSGQLDHARLAVLADALEEVGADAWLLAHLREPVPHPAGCYAVDLVRATAVKSLPRP